LSSFPRERMARIKDTTCGSFPLFSLVPLFSLSGNDEKCSPIFIASLPLPIFSFYLISRNPLSPSFCSSYSSLSTSIFVLWDCLPSAKALKIVLLSLFSEKGVNMDGFRQNFWQMPLRLREEDGRIMIRRITFWGR